MKCTRFDLTCKTIWYFYLTAGYARSAWNIARVSLLPDNVFWRCNSDETNRAKGKMKLLIGQRTAGAHFANVAVDQFAIYFAIKSDNNKYTHTSTHTHGHFRTVAQRFISLISFIVLAGPSIGSEWCFKTETWSHQKKVKYDLFITVVVVVRLFDKQYEKVK